MATNQSENLVAKGKTLLVQSPSSDDKSTECSTYYCGNPVSPDSNDTRETKRQISQG